jgi:hypothetical protein
MKTINRGRMKTKTRAVVGGFAVSGVVALLYVAASAADFSVPPPGRDVLFPLMILAGWFTGWRLFGRRWDDLSSTFPKREK